MEPKPDEFIPTRASLLERLKDWEDNESWQEFFAIYRRLVFGTARKAGLTEVEAEEVVQETLISVAKTIKDFKYDRERCTFKSWLGHLTRKRVADQFRKRAKQPLIELSSRTGDTQTPVIERIPDEQAARVEDLWEEEWRTNLIRAALNSLKTEISGEQFQIFDLYVVRKLKASEVAAAVGVSVGQVYLSKHRVARLLKREVKRLEAELNKGMNHA
jgi:RNA polymerase sigma-70 factor (ECF subfamily)